MGCGGVSLSSLWNFWDYVTSDITSPPWYASCLYRSVNFPVEINQNIADSKLETTAKHIKTSYFD